MNEEVYSVLDDGHVVLLLIRAAVLGVAEIAIHALDRPQPSGLSVAVPVVVRMTAGVLPGINVEHISILEDPSGLGFSPEDAAPGASSSNQNLQRVKDPPVAACVGVAKKDGPLDGLWWELIHPIVEASFILVSKRECPVVGDLEWRDEHEQKRPGCREMRDLRV